MRKKIIISIVAVVVLITAIVAVTVIKNKTVPGGGRAQSYESMEEATKEAVFNMDYPDRLGGYPATNYKANSSTIEVQYADAGFIRKTLGVADNSGSSSGFDEVSEQSVDGMKVTLKGKDGLIFLAVWKDNNYAYTISVNEGIDVSEMTDYIESTR